MAGRYERSPARVMTVSVVAICAMLAVIQLTFEPLLSVTAGLSQPVRIVLGLALIAPLGVPLGMLFPTGLALVRRGSPLFVPWAFGVNGVFSVIGTSVVLPGAVLFGFPTMVAAAGAVYLVALAVGVPLARRA